MFTDEELRVILDALETCGGVKTEAAKKLGVSVDRVKRGVKRAAERGMSGYTSVMPGFRISQVTNTPNGDFIKQQPERGEAFSVPEGHTIKGVSALVDPDGREIIKWVKTREEDAGKTLLLETIKEQLTAASNYASLPPPPAVVNNDLLAFYPIADVHLGAFAWSKETGADYDLDIAERILKQCTGELISRSAPAETAIILDVGDFFHGDNTRNQTGKSANPLDIDSRHPKVVQTGFMAVVWIIEQALQKHAKVIYRKLAGNHDEETSSTFALGIWAWFRNNPRVDVDISPSRTFKHLFGKTLIAAAHGDMLKMQDLAGWLAATHPKDWGDSEYRSGWTGHIHNKTALTSMGMTTESLNSPAAKDAWHAAMGFSAPRNMISVTYDRERGERDRLTVSVRG
jgi:hypothetical protein